MKKLQQIIILVFTLTIVSCSSESHPGKIDLKEGKEVTTGYTDNTYIRTYLVEVKETLPFNDR